MPPRNDISAGLMSFGDHLEELRKRLFLAIVVPLPLSVILFFFAPIIRALAEYSGDKHIVVKGLDVTTDSFGVVPYSEKSWVPARPLTQCGGNGPASADGFPARAKA